MCMVNYSIDKIVTQYNEKYIGVNSGKNSNGIIENRSNNTYSRLDKNNEHEISTSVEVPY